MKNYVLLKIILVILFFIPKVTFAIDPPVITATGNQIYCPGTSLKIVETISITFDPLEPTTDAVYIQITSGFAIGDILTLTNSSSHPTISTDLGFNSITGSLKLSSSTGSKIPYSDFEGAIKDVHFSNSSPSPSGTRTFSISLGVSQLSYLPSNKHFYEYVPALGITWTAAKVAAETRTPYYGLQGYLATLTTADEAQLAGAQAPGAGWIGGSDSQTEGVWKWVTGPEGLANGGTGVVFWNGVTNGSTPNFAFWNTGEPNQSGEEDYAHITAPGVGIPGSWNDLKEAGDPITNYNYYPKGYIVEYGGMVPGDVDNLNISASTTISMTQLTVNAPNPICASQTTMLQASSSTGTINWYDSTGNFLKAGNNYTTPTLNTTTTYYIDNGCTTRTPITVTVESLPIANPVTINRQCDDNQDGIFTFNTSSLESTLLNGQTNVIVAYLDAANNPLKDANGMLITSPFPTTFIPTSQTIQAVITNNSTLKCSSKTTIDFIVDKLPKAFDVPISLTTACDDEPIPTNQDGKLPFNTSNIESTILNGQTGMKISYFDKNDNPLSSPLPNPFLTDTQNVTAKVENILNPICFDTTTLNFVVNPLPMVKDVAIIQCDDDLDLRTLFNLEIKNNSISANAVNESFSYFISQSGANTADATQLINNFTAFPNTTSPMDVWVRVTNKNNCFSVAKLTLIVAASQFPTTYSPFVPSVCDDTLAADGTSTGNPNINKRDGISAFDLRDAIKDIESKLPPPLSNYTIKYYRNKADGLLQNDANGNSLAIAPSEYANFRNDIPYAQNIWVRVNNNLSFDCGFGFGDYIKLTVEKLPYANPVSIPRQCDDNQDGILSFDTSNLETTLKGTNQTFPVTVTYFDAANNPLKDENGVSITSPFPNTFLTKSQTIKAVVTNNTTQKCFEETTIQFIVDDLPEAFAIDPNLTSRCDNELDPMTQDGKLPFDTSTFQSTILNGQIGMNVKYFDQNGNPLPSPLPNPYVTGTQNIRVVVENPINTTCFDELTIPFIVKPLPKINLNTDGSEDNLVCQNDPTFFVQLNAGIQDGSSTSNYTYIWSKDGTVLPTEKSYTLDVNAEGVYTVEVSNSVNCGRTRTIKVTASNEAQIDSIQIRDMTDINTVTVILIPDGQGDYEYSIDDPYGPWQNSNFFDNVSAGIHEVYINDKNGCGLISRTISVVGVPKFFTPNNDGHNDYWGIKGVNASFYSNSIIYIFNRFGKLLKQWVPSSSEGWDGTFNGAPMPSDDYWYTIKLEDGREAKGHFSLKR